MKAYNMLSQNFNICILFGICEHKQICWYHLLHKYVIYNFQGFLIIYIADLSVNKTHY